MFDNDDDDGDIFRRIAMQRGMPQQDLTENMTQDQQIELLTSLVKQADEVFTFSPGVLVTWKEGLNIMRSTGPFIFRRYLENPVQFERDPASMFYCEYADSVVAALVTSNTNNVVTLAEWAVPSRRLRPFYDLAKLS